MFNFSVQRSSGGEDEGIGYFFVYIVLGGLWFNYYMGELQRQESIYRERYCI